MKERAILLRERRWDDVDPDPRFAWVVEMDRQIGALHAITRWSRQNEDKYDDYKDRYRLNGRFVVFADRDDAMLFYLKYA